MYVGLQMCDPAKCDLTHDYYYENKELDLFGTNLYACANVNSNDIPSASPIPIILFNEHFEVYK